MASQFERLEARLITLEDLVRQVMYLLGVAIDKDSLQLGLDESEPRFFERTPGIPSAPQTVEQFETGESPRERLPYKALAGGEAFVEWHSLDGEMQQAINFARGSDEPWQLYEGNDGEMRISISSQVANQLRAWKLGNPIGK